MASSSSWLDGAAGAGRKLAITAAVGVTAVLCGGASPAAAACPNEALREQQQWASHLGDCRAYEMVSPVDKNGAGVKPLDEQTNVFVPAPLGGGLLYAADGTFPGASASFKETGYVGTRGAESWATWSISPHDFGTLSGSRYSNLIATSADLTRSLVVSLLPLAPGAVDGEYNVYLEDNRTGALQFVYSAENEPQIARGDLEVGGDASFGRVVFLEPAALTPDAADNGEAKLYEFSNGELRLASVFPDGSPATDAIFLRGVSRPELGNLVSADGSRVFFSVGEGSPACASISDVGCKGLYVRENGQSRLVSASQRTGEKGEVGQGSFRDASADGSVAFFTSRQPLTDASWDGPIAPTSDGSLYRYELDSGELADLTITSDPENSEGPSLGVFGGIQPLASRDGSVVYFMAAGKLTPEAVKGNANLYVWHGGALSLAVTAPELGLRGSASFRISPDGSWAAFESKADLIGGSEACPADGPYAPAGACARIYAFSLDSGELTCASCPQSPSVAWRHATLGQARSNPVADDGRVYFQTSGRLVSGDSNNARDVYEWQAGRQSLISTGSASTPSIFLGASNGGRDVYFSTDQQLLATDTDDLVDAYDARVGGGLASQMTASTSGACEGDRCLPPANGAPPTPSMQTAGYAGAASKELRCAKPRKQKRSAHKPRKKGATAKKSAAKKKHAKKPSKKRACGRSGK